MHKKSQEVRGHAQKVTRGKGHVQHVTRGHAEHVRVVHNTSQEA